MFTVAEVMTTDLYTLGPDQTLAEARKLMAEQNIRHIPIVSGSGELCGVVSQRDVLAASDSSLESLAVDSHDGIPLSCVMTSSVATVDKQESLRGAALYLQKHRLGSLPVVEDGKLVGIITDTDYVGIAINLMEQLEELEPEGGFDGL